jgi:hypothetical protein
MLKGLYHFSALLSSSLTIVRKRDSVKHRNGEIARIDAVWRALKNGRFFDEILTNFRKFERIPSGLGK